MQTLEGFCRITHFGAFLVSFQRLACTRHTEIKTTRKTTGSLKLDLWSRRNNCFDDEVLWLHTNSCLLDNGQAGESDTKPRLGQAAKSLQ